jgi:hypothetical protein
MRAMRLMLGALVCTLTVFTSLADEARSRSDSAAPAARDFGGTWERSPPVPSSASGGGQPASGASPPGSAPLVAGIPAPPLKPEVRAAYDAEQKRIQEADARGEPLATGYTHCLPDGMPAMMQAMFPMEVLQTRGQVTIIQEAYNQVRRIYIDAEAVPIEDAEPGFWGHSTARWDGDTLVVDTVGIKDYVRFRNVPHSNQMRIREEMRVLDENRFENRVTVTDPVYLTGPWSWTWTYQRKPDYKMYEYVCEDNREYADPETGATRLRVTEPEG